jgi:hypothetical protein
VSTTEKLSDAQVRALRRMIRDENRLPVQIAGYRAAPLLSASKALVRKGFAKSGQRTGWYAITEEGARAYLEQTQGGIEQAKEERG